MHLMSSAKLLISDCFLVRAAAAARIVFAIPHPISGPATRLLIRNAFCDLRDMVGLEIEEYRFSILRKKYNAPLLTSMGDVFVQEERVVLSTFPVPCEAEFLGAQHARCIPQNTQVFIFVVQQFGI